MESAVQSYEEAVVELPTSVMWDMYINFLLDKLVYVEDDGDYIASLLDTFGRAESAGCLSENSYTHWIGICRSHIQSRY